MVYIAGVGNLMLIMTLLRDPSRSIAFEAFHVFKVFVANPNKSPGVLEVLAKNTDKLLRFLSDFQGDREDEDFAKEKEVRKGGSLPCGARWASPSAAALGGGARSWRVARVRVALNDFPLLPPPQRATDTATPPFSLLSQMLCIVLKQLSPP